MAGPDGISWNQAVTGAAVFFWSGMTRYLRPLPTHSSWLDGPQQPLNLLQRRARGECPSRECPAQTPFAVSG